jgi:molybdopterin molybdotransferase
MQEDTDARDTGVLIRRACGRGDNVRQAGEDIPAGGVVARTSDRITPPLLGVLASLGLDEVEVYGRPRVAVFSTGDEIREPGGPLPRGCVYDSNRYALRALLAGSHVEIVDLGLIPDDREQLRHALSEAAAVSDAILTSGGVSVGEADFIKEILGELGAVAFWKLAIKPGRPLTFGTLGNSLFFGLPGNPVAAMVTFLQFVQPALEKLSGATPQPPVLLRARCRDRLRKRPGRREFQRAILTQDASGALEVALTGRQGSGVLTSMSLANCLIVLTEEQESVDPGTEVGVELLPWARIATVQSS